MESQIVVAVYKNTTLTANYVQCARSIPKLVRKIKNLKCY